MGEHRVLRFESIGELEGELGRVEEAEREGKIEAMGKWEAGQILNHLGAWIEFGYEGYPGEVPPPPLPLRVMLRVMKRRILTKPLPVGLHIPKVKGGTVATEVALFDEGLARLRRNLDRLKRGESPKFASPAFGLLTHEQAVLAALRHAELHLGFLKY